MRNVFRSMRELSTPQSAVARPFANRRSLLTWMRSRKLWLRSIAVVVATAFLNLYLQPLAVAAQLPSPPAPTAPTNEERLSQTIGTIQARLDQLQAKLERKEDVAREKSELKRLRESLEVQDLQTLEDFDAIGRSLKEKKLPQVILDRHDQAVSAYRQEMARLKANLLDLEEAKDDAQWQLQAQKAGDHLRAKQTNHGQKSKFDPNDLPNKSLKPNRENKPKLSPKDFLRAGYMNNPAVTLAALGDFKFDKLPGASDPAYLASTPEIGLTDAIKAKAQELNYDPVSLYNWVRNNVEWIPTWGAQQDAEVTLGSQRGNALDIASLLIALYRASGIPARYVHGVIEVPSDKFMNWAGGFTDVNVTGDYVSSGGIPVISVVSGGRVTKVRVEHIWVEAAIDFHPSRGMVNKNADSWVQLDPSYKQYQDLPGLDVASISGTDAKAVAQSFVNSATTNPSEGWVAGLNPAVVQGAQTQGQAAVTSYISNSLPNAKVGEVLGGRKIIPLSATVLPAALAAKAVVIGARYGTLPPTLQNTMTFAFGTDAIGEPINPITLPWAVLNNHKVTLSFRPATAADQQALNSLLPQGPITDLSQLPSSIPAYLISVVPELAIDEVVRAQGEAMRLGEDLNFSFQVTRVGDVGSQPYVYAVVAGSFESVLVGGSTVSRIVLQDLQARLSQTYDTFKSGDPNAIGTLTRERILGDALFAGTLKYIGDYLTISQAMTQRQNARQNLPVAYGTVGYEPKVQTLFGIPRAIQKQGITVNVRLGQVIRPANGDMTKQFGLALQTGLLSSALEHSVPEGMFADAAQPSVQAVSAVKALYLANQLGQRIYHITPANQAQTIGNLHLDALAMSEITQALAVGREVIAHTDRIALPGWSGEGYVLIDPVTGDGAYKIAGGANGGHFPWDDIFTFLTAGALGYVDGKVGRFKDETFIFSDLLKRLSFLAKISQAVGVLALLVSLAKIFFDDKLDVSQTIGQASLELLGFAITAYLTEAIVLLFVPPFAVLAAVFIAVALAVAIAYLKALYFTELRIRRQRLYA